MNSLNDSASRQDAINNAKESLSILQEYQGQPQSASTPKEGGINPFIAYSLMSILISGSILLIFFLRKKLIS